MKDFTDKKGRKWFIEIDGQTISRVLSSTGDINLGNISDGSPPLYQRIFNDLALVGRVVWELIAKQAFAVQPNITIEDFMASLDGRTIREAKAALMEELVFFFLEAIPATGAQIKAYVETVQACLEAGQKRLATIDPAALARKYVESFPSTLGGPSGDTPGSAESIPAG